MSRGRFYRLMAGVFLMILAPLSVSTCGGTGGIETAGGGTGGTGISTGAITAFGSVVLNGVHFLTDDNVTRGYVTKKMFNGADNSFRRDREVFAVGMIVAVRHAPADNNATEIDFQDNLRGPVASKSIGDNTIVVLGRTVVVDDAALLAALNRDVVMVSGFADAGGRIRAEYVEVLRHVPHYGDEYEIKGFVSGLTGDAFRLGSLPGGSSETVTVTYDTAAISGLPAALENGMYVQVVTTDAAPVGGRIAASRIGRLAPRTEFPEGATVDLDGLVTSAPVGSGAALSFDVEGKQVRTDAGTDFTGHAPSDVRSNARIQVRGTEAGGTLSAGRIIFR